MPDDNLQFATELRVVCPNAPSAVQENGSIRGDMVQSVLVEQDMNQPDMCTVAFDNSNREFSGEMKVGDPLKVFFGRKGEDNLEIVFDGEIVGVEPTYGAQGESRCVVRSFNKMHRLVRGRFSRTFEGMTEKQIVSEVVDGKLSVKCDIEETQTHVYQHNQTNLEFLLHRAKVHGAQLYVEGNTLYFMSPDHERDFRQDIVLELKSPAEFELKQFSPRMSSADIVNAVEVIGWDPTKKQKIVHRATPDNSSLGHGRLGEFLGSDASLSFGNQVSFSVDSPSFDKQEAQSKAESLLYDSMMDFITGTGVVVGRSALRAGQVVEVKLYCKNLSYDPDYRFNGRYFLTGVSHRYTREKSGNFGGYQSMIRVRRDAHAGTS